MAASETPASRIGRKYGTNRGPGRPRKRTNNGNAGQTHKQEVAGLMTVTIQLPAAYGPSLLAGLGALTANK